MKDRKDIRNNIGYTHTEQLENADLWYNNSLSFNEASCVLYEYQEQVTGGLRVYLFNAALSLELILTAILAAKAEAIPTIHTLRELCIKAEVEFDEDQAFILDLLTESILLASWYPSSKSEVQWNNLHDNIIEKLIRQQSGNHNSTLANQKRFPSLENYTKIWRICLVKYANILRETEHD